MRYLFTDIDPLKWDDICREDGIGISHPLTPFHLSQYAKGCLIED